MTSRMMLRPLNVTSLYTSIFTWDFMDLHTFIATLNQVSLINVIKIYIFFFLYDAYIQI